ncbi:MAG: ABC transporter ATP-binding protein [Candidatus Heimdallarchaeota archaeon]
MSHGRGPGGLMSGHLQDKSRTRPTKHLLGILGSYLSHYKKRIFFISLIILIYTLAGIITPVIIGNALDIVAEDEGTTSINNIILLFVIFSASVWVFQSLNNWFTAEVRTRFLHDIRTDVFDDLVDADMKFHHANESGNITSRVINDTEELANGLTIVTTGSSQLLMVVGTFLVLLYLSWTFALIALLAIPASAFITILLGTIGKRTMLRVRQAYGRVSGKLSESLAGVAISKAFNREEWTSGEIQTLNDETYRYYKQLGAIFMLIMPSVIMVSTYMIGLTLLAGGYMNSQSGSFTIGMIYLGTILVQRFLAPVIHLANFATQLQASLAAMDRLADVLEAHPAVADQSSAVSLEVSTPAIEFRDLSFSYMAGTEVLDNVSFKINPGEKVAIVGHTGAGKTTLTALLMRFYDPDSGAILIDNQDLRTVTLESIHSTISLIPQEPYLFADTVLENIRYGRPSAIDQEIIELCELIGADQFIEALPYGYQTKLTESGKSLSAGQRQMITIARAMVSDPKILVLDEATSRLDAYSESLVQIAQHMLFKGRTTIVIAHRLSTIRDVDRIAVMKSGKLVELGTHDELMAQEGIYSDVYQTYYAHQGVRAAEEILDSDIDLEETVQVKNHISHHAMVMRKEMKHKPPH